MEKKRPNALKKRLMRRRRCACAAEDEFLCAVEYAHPLKRRRMHSRRNVVEKLTV
jgi:hypothetical protein